jgi:hypothetical protein
MKKKLILICLVIFLLIVACIFISNKYQSKIIQNNDNKIASSSPQINQQDNAVSSSSSGVLATSSSDSKYPTFAEINSVKVDKGNWQVYKDEKYGFEISAPAGWSFIGKLDLFDGTELLIMPNSVGKFNAPTAIGILHNTSSPRDWLKEYRQQAKNNPDPEQIMEISIPTSDGAFVALSHGIYGASVKKGNYVFVFGSMDSSSDLLNQYAMMKAIITTLRFTK